MENYIKYNLIDITFMSELILDIFDVKDLIHPNDLRSLAFRKSWAH